MTVYEVFCKVAIAVDDIYGSSLIFDEDSGEIDGYLCPHCGEPIYFDDWVDSYYLGLTHLNECPICTEDLEVD